MIEFLSTLRVIYLFALIFLIFKYGTSNNKEKTIFDKKHINEDSFQKYAKFYGEYVPSDDKFDYKLNQICTLIKEKNMNDINQITIRP